MAAIPVGASEHRHKRIKLNTSEPAIPAKSPLLSTSTSHASKNADDPESESESELSESSKEPSSESESDEDSEVSNSEAGQREDDEDKVINLRANRGNKPVMKFKHDELGPDIRGFLKEFLPQLKAANDELEEQRKAGTLKNREIDAEIDAETDEKNQIEQYIEMNLGLGVLEAKTSDTSDSSDSEGDDEPKEKDILGKLMGRKNTGAAGIQELQENPDANT